MRKLKPEVVRSKSGGVFIKIQYQLNKRKPGEIYIGFRRTRNCRVDCSFFDKCHRIHKREPSTLCGIVFSEVRSIYQKVLELANFSGIPYIYLLKKIDGNSN